MNYMSKYILSASIIGLSIYLKSPLVAVSLVAFWALNSAEVVLNQKNRDSEINGLLLRMEKIEKEHKGLSLDITNVAERAKQVLGEVY